MIWTHNQHKFKTKEDVITLLEEIEAYRELDGQDFDFGSGLIKNDMQYGSEDAYYEMDIQQLEDILSYFETEEQKELQKREDISFFIKKQRQVTYQEKRKHKKRRRNTVKSKNKLKQLHQYTNSVFSVTRSNNWYQQVYRGSRSHFLKKASNKKVRQYPGSFPTKSCTYKKVFDFWWELD